MPPTQGELKGRTQSPAASRGGTKPEKGSAAKAGAGEQKEGGWGKLIFLAVGTLGSFTVFGYAQEALTSKKYGDEKFGFTSFLVLVQSIGNALLAAVVLLVTGRGAGFGGGVPVKEWLVVALGYLGAHKFGLWALKYIIFPLQVVVKSCKSIPVMFGEMLFAKVQHSLAKRLGVFLMCAGVVMFTLFGDKKNKSQSFQLDSDTCFGLGLVFLALICDGVYGPYQNKIVKEYKPNAYHLMFNMNVYQGLFSVFICLYDGEIAKAASFISRHPDVIFDLAQFSAAMGLGNIFIYNLQREFGALTVTTTTTLRKLISVLFSVVYFGHSLAMLQWGAIGLVFAAGPLSQQLAKIIEGEKKDKKDKKA